MPEREPMTKTMQASDARQQWNELIGKVSRKQTRVLVEENGTPVAAIVSPEDLDRLTQFDQEREADFAILDEIGAAFKDVAPEELEREVQHALSAVRAENRKGEQPAAPKP
jgi:prevent-host-death family protein